MRYYSSTATPKTLTSVGGINSSVTSMTVDSTTGLPGSFPYTLVLDPDLVSEEIVSVTAAAGTTLTIVRGQDSTSATSHAAGAVIKHMITARDLQEPQNHMNTGSAVHGLSGTVVGTTDTQTLTNKTISGASNTLSNIAQASVANLTSDLALKAPLASPALTGTPTSPTAAADTNTTQVATTAFVVGQASATTPAANGTAAVGTSLKYARADHVHAATGVTVVGQLGASTITATSGNYYAFPYDLESVDNINGHSTTTNNDRFTVSSSGYYLITARTQVNNASVAEQIIMAITKNGVAMTNDSNVVSYMTGAGKSQVVSTSCILYLNASEYVGARYYVYNSGTTLTFSTFTITYVGA